MNKEALISALENSYKAVLTELENVSEEAFYQQKNDKWSAAQNLAHLTLSAKILKRALVAPKVALAARFGMNFKEQKDLKWIKQTYGVATFPAVTGFEPRMSPETSKSYEIEQFIKHHKDIVKGLDSWSEWQLNLLKLPQPVFGKLSVREMSLFFSFHIDHHLKAIKLVLAK